MISKNSAEMRELFQMDGARVRRAIRKLAFNETVDSRVRLRALVEILDAHGERLIAPTEITGRDGQPLPLGVPRDATEELVSAQRIAFMLMAAPPPLPDGGPHSDRV